MKKTSLFLGLLMLATALVFGFCLNGTSSLIHPAEGEISIGKQTWMTQNLNVDHFRNGDPIPEVKTEEEWEKAGKEGKPAWCYYENDPANGPKYGKLYNWYAVIDPRGLAPTGWHIPEHEEWITLIKSLKGKKDSGTKMKSTGGWAQNGNGNNLSGFNGLPGGYRMNQGHFLEFGTAACFWSSTELNTAYGAYCFLKNTSAIADTHSDNKGIGFSVRCIKDAETAK